MQFVHSLDLYDLIASFFGDSSRSHRKQFLFGKLTQIPLQIAITIAFWEILFLLASLFYLNAERRIPG